MITLDKIQKNIIQIIKQSNLKQIEIAKKLKVSPQTISYYVHGEKMPALDTFANLCQTLDVNPADILCVNVADTTQVSDRYINEVLQIMLNVDDNGKQFILSKALEYKKNKV